MVVCSSYQNPSLHWYARSQIACNSQGSKRIQLASQLHAKHIRLCGPWALVRDQIRRPAPGGSAQTAQIATSIRTTNPSEHSSRHNLPQRVFFSLGGFDPCAPLPLNPSKEPVRQGSGTSTHCNGVSRAVTMSGFKCCGLLFGQTRPNLPRTGSLDPALAADRVTS